MGITPAVPERAVTSAGRDLLRRWSEPHRRYHNLDHLRAVLRAIDLLRADAAEPGACTLAAWFHDAVYEGRPGNDERASARLARYTLSRLAVLQAQIAEVVRLIELTATHDPAPSDRNGAVLCDADLAILGSTPDEYAGYVAAVRDEYSAVPDDEFRAGRADVLQSLLRRDPLYSTLTGRKRWEDAARRNLTAELEQLKSPK